MVEAQGTDWLQVGLIVGPHGVRGEMKVELTTDFPDRFAGLETIYVGSSYRPMKVAGARRIGSRVALRLRVVADRDGAELLRGQALYVPRAEAVPLPEGHYYYDQIVGLRAVTISGMDLGPIVEILSTGSNDVYVAHTAAGEVLIPALKVVVRQIDLQAGIMVIDPPEGLL